MKVSLNWLKDYIDLNGIPLQEIVHKLTMTGLEVENVINELEIYKDFIVGYVKEKSKHPNADKLSLCTVSTGSEDYQVICGASNVAKGQKIVFAPIGTTIPKGNFKIGKAKIRGVESFGMICSEAELELSENHDGIMILENGAKIGMPITEALNLNDVIIEIGITPNRPDALSHLGVARDLSAIFNLELKYPKIESKKSSENIYDLASVEILDEKKCPRYSAKVIKNITIKKSPEWLKNRISKIGLRSINNIVDVTNFVMNETGQPLHAFDLDLLKGNKIIVKSIEEESTFTTLDSKVRKLPADTLMICDAEKPIAVAGVMGGENSEINTSTKNILIESAYFNQSSIRKASRGLGLSTEASYRFERGTDPGRTDYAAERAAQLIAEISGGNIAEDILDIYPNRIKPVEVRLRYERIFKLLGYEIPQQNVKKILMKLGFNIILESEKGINVLVPTFRPDIEREVDIIEEIARIDSYDNIPTITKISVTLGNKIDESEFKDNIRNIAGSLGLYEMINNPLQHERLASMTGNAIKIINPQSIDMAYLRTSLIPGALSVISHNLKLGEKALFLYEIGNVFNKKSDQINSFYDFSEVEKLIISITGRLNEKEWFSEEKFSDFYYLKGLINSLLSKLSLDNVLNDSYYHDSDSIYDFYFTKSINEKPLGYGGKVKKEILLKFDIEQEVFCFEFDVKELKNIKAENKRYKETLKYPKVNRDFAFIFDKSVTYQEVINFIENEGSDLLKAVKIFDVFENRSLGEDKKSMAFTLDYYSMERTLTEEEVEKEFNNLIFSISKEFNAKLRGGN